VDLCGHATLAAAHAIYEQGRARADASLQFHTRSGVLSASREAGRIVLDFPVQSGKPVPVEAVRQCLGVAVLAASFNGSNLLAEVESLPALLACAPDMTAIAALDAQGLIVTTANECGIVDFASRYFAPQVGVPEDPVCGSAHCMLAPYWAEKLGKKMLHALQASKRRGELFITLKDGRVMLAGYAVTSLRGELLLEERYVVDHAA
jgi:PhzF family phenazine biosynthesis protein